MQLVRNNIELGDVPSSPALYNALDVHDFPNGNDAVDYVMIDYFDAAITDYIENRYSQYNREMNKVYLNEY